MVLDFHTCHLYCVDRVVCFLASPQSVLSDLYGDRLMYLLPVILAPVLQERRLPVSV